MKVFGILISLIILGASNVFAIIDIQGGVWLLSSLSGTNATVAETLTLIENDAKNGNLKEAISKSKEFRAENEISDYYLTNGELLPLTLEVIELMNKWQSNAKHYYSENAKNSNYWYYKLNAKDDITEEDIFQAKYGE